MEEKKGFSLNNQELQKYLPNKYPYLMVDRVTEVIPGVSAKGYKNLTANEWFFPCHFPEEPMMPGMIQMEALIQMISLTVLTLDDNAGEIVNGISADKIRLKRRVVPGDRLDIEAELISWKRGIAKGKAVGTVDGELACSVEFKFVVPKILKQYEPKAGAENNENE
jgi:3-hydroxyacyl-[acyl-carrier-protein] dehydratase